MSPWVSAGCCSTVSPLTVADRGVILFRGYYRTVNVSGRVPVFGLVTTPPLVTSRSCAVNEVREIRSDTLKMLQRVRRERAVGSESNVSGDDESRWKRDGAYVGRCVLSRTRLVDEDAVRSVGVSEGERCLME